MKINQRHQLVRLQLLNNGNFGAAGGRATLDRPTQTEAYFGLPYIPNSSWRGVWRNWWEVKPNAATTADIIFGTRDDPEKPQRVEPKPGKLVIGNGELLCFPLLSEVGERCWIFPLHNICKYVALEKLCTPKASLNLKAVVTAVYAGKKDHRYVLGIPKMPALNTIFKLEQANPAPTETQKLRKLLKRWYADWLSENEMILVVDDKVATHLWQQASEVRDLTALEDSKTARAQSLRRIETIPEGSIFLSLSTWLGEDDLDFGDQIIQIGSGEGLGNGFCRIATVETTTVGAVFAPLEESEQGLRERNDKAMSEMYREIVAIARNENHKLKQKIRSAIGGFGWRIKQEGWEAALAFALAKARPSAKATPERKISEDTEAYRWLLRNMFKLNEAIDKYQGEPWFTKEINAGEKSEIVQRWLWLRKFSEIELPPAIIEEQ